MRTFPAIMFAAVACCILACNDSSSDRPASPSSSLAQPADRAALVHLLTAQPEPPQDPRFQAVVDAPDDAGDGPTINEEANPEAGDAWTNLQEAAIDEADAVKTDGRWWYTVSDGVVRIWDIEAPADPAASLELPFMEDAHEQLCYLVGDRLLVLARTWGLIPDQAAQAFSDAPAPMPGSYHGSLLLMRIDIADPTAPRLDRIERVDGTLGDTRRDGDALVAVTTLGRWQLMDLPEERLIPRWQLLDPEGTILEERELIDASSAWYDPDEALGDLTLVLRWSVSDAEKPPVACALLGRSDGIYAAPGRLFLRNTQWMPVAGLTSTASLRTKITAIDIHADQPIPVAVGGVWGWIPATYGMSLHEGTLRVASQEWNRGSRITCLQDRDGQLETTGTIADIAPDERLYASRFVGEAAYLVTFRQTDPLWVADLSDPNAPRLLGELEMPGFSDYLHPLSDGRLLGVGQDADPDTGRTRGLLVSIFDISDPTQPVIQRQWHDESTWSRARLHHDPHDFFIDAQERFCFHVIDAGQAHPQALVFDLAEDPLAPLMRVNNTDISPWSWRPAHRAKLIGERLVLGGPSTLQVLPLASAAPDGDG